LGSSVGPLGVGLVSVPFWEEGAGLPIGQLAAIAFIPIVALGIILFLIFWVTSGFKEER